MKRIFLVLGAVAWLGFSSVAAVAQTNSGGTAGVSSVGTACGVIGGPITATGTVSGAAADNSQSSSAYTIASTDCGKVIRLTGASPVATAPALPSSGFSAGYFTSLKCEAASGSCSTSGTIDGSASAITIAVGNSVDLYVDGSNGWHKLPGNAASGVSPGGSNGQIQINNSGSFGGVSNISASQLPPGQVNHPGYDTGGVWYLPLNYPVRTASGTPVPATAYCTLGIVGGNANITVQALGLQTTTPGSSNFQFAIYNDAAGSSGAPHRPSTLVIASGSAANNVTNVIAAITATALAPGFYWWCVQTNDTTVRWQAITNGYGYGAGVMGSATAATVLGGGIDGVSTSTGIVGFGTWPGFVGATFTEVPGTGPIIGFQTQ